MPPAPLPLCPVSKDHAGFPGSKMVMFEYHCHVSCLAAGFLLFLFLGLYLKLCTRHWGEKKQDSDGPP